MLLFYVRHGDPIYNPDSLTPLGERQAEAVAKRLCRYGIDEVHASTSKRAHMTAKPTADILKLPIIDEEWAKEGNAWSTLTVIKEDGKRKWLFQDKESIQKLNSPEVRALGEKWYEAPCFDGYAYGEGLSNIGKNADAFLASLGYEHDREHADFVATAPNDRRIALFAHQGMGLAFLSQLLDIPYPTVSTRMDFGHSSMTVIKFGEPIEGRVIPKVLQLSNDSHIYAEGLPTKYNNTIYF